jgi:hypothetical protein
MTCSAAYVSGKSIGEQIANSMPRWHARRRIGGFPSDGEIRQPAKQARVTLAVLAPSLAAEIAPLLMLWRSHLPVWQMSAIMAASWVFAWWLTWTFVLAMNAPGKSAMVRKPVEREGFPFS